VVSLLLMVGVSRTRRPAGAGVGVAVWQHVRVSEPHVSHVPVTDGVSLAVHDHGGDAPPLVLVHANGFHARAWDPVVRRLAGRYRCIAVDLRGHGDSVLPDGAPLDWRRSGDDLLLVIEALELGQGIRAAGWSMGGAVIVLAELARPGTIGAAFLFEPILFPRPTAEAMGENPMAAVARRRREVFADRTVAYERFEGRGPFARCTSEGLHAYVDHAFVDLPDGTVRLKCRGETEARNFETPPVGAFEQLGGIWCRVVVGGSGDGAPPALMASAVAEAVPGGRFASFPDLTHFAPLEDPGLIAEAIVDAVG
jgi:pimeloyl-ACP methyl ester carboxylesterase